MSAVPPPRKPQGPAALFAPRRVRFTLILAIAIGLLFTLTWESGRLGLLMRTAGIGLWLMLVFGLFEQWPRRLPRWLARWVLQVLAVAVAVPVATITVYIASTAEGAPPFWEEGSRLSGFASLTVTGLLVAPWTALGALVRQKDALARHQALAFALERSELERQAIGARLHLLQAQTTPHFLFNTLANVQALVDAGSPRAAALLRSLIAYLRAAVPRLDEPAATVRHELDLVRAYLDLMQMRFPDRLAFALHADPAARGLHCPPLTVLTLVENAVRHGIDPSEDGGRIEVTVHRDGARCRIRVADTGAGLGETGGSLGTGLSTLRERLALAFDGDVQLTLRAQTPRGVAAMLDFPAREVSP
ncbi:MAG TPA: histidine kinase [Dokdonella sp.]|uniref:sensor histidine kinase n=1 Tax=Dokdonella sp. TaxID=2291710 RepID=UPI002B606EF6|nr:histidine kinase [Dokdonella sp.]HUD40836.1 histidine kinase [Dokdonella sp.]